VLLCLWQVKPRSSLLVVVDGCGPRAGVELQLRGRGGRGCGVVVVGQRGLQLRVPVVDDVGRCPRAGVAPLLPLVVVDLGRGSGVTTRATRPVSGCVSASLGVSAWSTSPVRARSRWWPVVVGGCAGAGGRGRGGGVPVAGRVWVVAGAGEGWAPATSAEVSRTNAPTSQP
jgi:hypothetical protein